MAYDWIIYREEACRLYRSGWTLQQIQGHFGKQYECKAKTRVWRIKLKEWGVLKRPDADTTRKDKTNKRKQSTDLPERHKDHSFHHSGTLHEDSGPENQSSADLVNKAETQKLSLPELCETLLTLWRDEDENERKKLLQTASFENGQNTILHYAAQQRHEYEFDNPLSHIIDYMETCDFDLTIVDTYQCTALEHAVRGSNEEYVDELLAADEYLAGIKPSSSEGSLLHMAVRRGSYSICKNLIGHLADLDEVDEGDDTPLSVAAISGKASIVELLLDNGATCGPHDSFESVLCECIKYGRNVEVCMAIFEKGIMRNKSSDSPKPSCRGAMAHSCGHFPFFKYLLENCSTLDPEELEDREVAEGLLERVRYPLFDGLDGTTDCLRIVLKQGFDPFPSHGLWFHFYDLISLPTAAFAYLRTCVEVCDLDKYGQGLFELLLHAVERQDGDEDTDDENKSVETSRFFDFLQTLIDRGLRLDSNINLLSYILSKAPNEKKRQKIKLLESCMKSGHWSPLTECPQYGRPLNLLTEIPAQLIWRLAEALSLSELPELRKSLDPLQIYNGDDFIGFTELIRYTSFPELLYQCILHDDTKKMIEQQLQNQNPNIEKIKWALVRRKAWELPDLPLEINSRVVYKMLSVLPDMEQVHDAGDEDLYS